MSSIPLSDIPTWKRVATAADATQHGLTFNATNMRIVATAIRSSRYSLKV